MYLTLCQAASSCIGPGRIFMSRGPETFERVFLSRSECHRSTLPWTLHLVNNSFHTCCQANYIFSCIIQPKMSFISGFRSHIIKHSGEKCFSDFNRRLNNCFISSIHSFLFVLVIYLIHYCNLIRSVAPILGMEQWKHHFKWARCNSHLPVPTTQRNVQLSALFILSSEYLQHTEHKVIKQIYCKYDNEAKTFCSYSSLFPKFIIQFYHLFISWEF